MSAHEKLQVQAFFQQIHLLDDCRRGGIYIQPDCLFRKIQDIKIVSDKIRDDFIRMDKIS